MPTALVGRGVDGVRIAGGELQVGRPGVRTEIEGARPGGAAILGPVHPAFAPAVPERPLGGPQDGVPVPRVHQDPADVLRAGEAHLLPGGAAVAAPIDAVTPADVTSAHVLPGAQPHHFRVGGVEGDRSEGVGRVLVKDRLPGGAAVLRLPEPAGTDDHIPGGAALRVHRDVRDAPAHERRTDAAQLQALDRCRDGAGVGIRGLRGPGGGREQQARDEERGQARAGPERAAMGVGGGWEHGLHPSFMRRPAPPGRRRCEC